MLVRKLAENILNDVGEQTTDIDRNSINKEHARFLEVFMKCKKQQGYFLHNSLSQTFLR